MVGAGAVGSSLAYWLNLFGVAGRWTVVDRDIVKIHNLNRSMLFEAADAGWPESEPRAKADVVSKFLPSSHSVISWYDEYANSSNEDFDVILGLANERNVRHFLACRNFPIILHATTGRNWLSQLNRHIAGVDDCIYCRVGEIASPVFGCSTGQSGATNKSESDAALPFLSAASGLMLATLLQRLQAGEISTLQTNDWRWDFESAYRMCSEGKRACVDSCTRVSPIEIRQKLHPEGLWKHLER
jgi:hypothetical protein